jgi:hypothetical protein
VSRKKHYIIPLFLLLLTLAPTLFMGGLQAFQFYIRQRMEKALEKEALTTIRLPATEVVWYEEGREIMIEGRMFDIKTFEIKNGTFSAVGVYDDDETEVVNLMKGHWSEKDQQHLIVQLLVLSHCVLTIHLLKFAFKSFPVRTILASVFLALYPAPVIPISVPPPRPFLFL